MVLFGITVCANGHTSSRSVRQRRGQTKAMWFSECSWKPCIIHAQTDHAMSQDGGFAVVEMPAAQVEQEFGTGKPKQGISA